MPKPEFFPFDEVEERLEDALASSVADETELVWLERKSCWVANHGRIRSFVEKPRLSVMARVVEGHRMGWYRTESAERNELDSGLRQALALARAQPKYKENQVFPAPAELLKVDRNLFDRRVSSLDADSASAQLGRFCPEGSRGRLAWSQTHLAVFNSHGLRRSAAVTEVSLDARAGRGPGTGRAAASARALEALDGAAVFERAERYRSDLAQIAPPDGPVPILLAPEASIELLNVLNAYAFSGRAYLDGTSFLTRHRNIQVFDRGFHLDDDGTRRAGLPFPFDLEGSLKKPFELIVEGKPSTPALNQHQGLEAGLEPTAQAVGGQDSLFGNLFLHAGDSSEEELRAAAAGGLFVGWLDRSECFAPAQLGIRATARGVRRIEDDGRLGPPIPDLVWEEKLLRALARLGAIGKQTVTRSMPSTPMGGISAPALVLSECVGFEPRHASKPD